MSDLPSIDDLLGSSTAQNVPGNYTYEADLDRRLAAQTQFRASLAKPDEAGRANVIARERGIPTPVVRGNLPAFEAQQKAKQFGDLARESPAVRKWGLDQRNAEIASDDVNPLRHISTNLNVISNIGKSLLAGTHTAVGGLQGAIAAAGEFGDAYSPFAWMERQLFGESSSAKQAKIARQFQKEQLASADAVRPKVNNWVARNLLSGVESLPLTVSAIGAGMLAGPEASAAVMGGSVGGNEYVRAREQGNSPAGSAVYGLSQGMIEYATEKIPASRLLTDLAKKSPFGKMILHQLAAEIPGEQVATVLQDLNEWSVLNPQKSFGDYLRARPMAAAETLIATVGGVGATVSLTKATERTATILGDVSKKGADASAAIDSTKAVDKLMKAAAESKTRQRDPEAFKALMQEMAGDHQVENIYVPAETVQSFMQSDGYNGEFDSFRSAVEEGVATGGDVVIPVSDAATRLAGTKAWDAIREDVRVTPGGMSPREAQAFNENISDVMAELADKMDRQAAEQKAGLGNVERLVQSLTEKLQNAGFTPHTARQQAELLAQRAQTRAVRTGQELTGNEYDQLAVNQVLPEKLAAAQKADKLDFVINAMKRKADVNTAPGKSLLEFVTEKGGVQDPGGDLKAMGAQDWHKAKKFRKKLIQDKGRTLDDLAQAAYEAGYFPGLTERPTINDMLDAMGQELGGRQVFANFASEGAAKADTQQAQLVQAADELRALLSEVGIDPATATSKEIRAAVEKYVENAAAGLGYDQSFADGPRGRITFPSSGYGRGKTIIDLFQSRDQSTFLHETGHLWLEELRADALASDTVRLYRGQGNLDASRQGDSKPGHLNFTTDPTIASNYAGRNAGGEVYYLDVPREQAAQYLGTGVGEHLASVPLGVAAGMKQFTNVEGLRQAAQQTGEMPTPKDIAAHVQEALAALPDNGVQLRADWKTVQDWFAANGHPLENGSIPTEAHEMWARGVERYLMEGKAPSPVLQKLFETFKSWLVQVYRTVAKLNTPITDDVRAVMDRLVATDEEITAAKEAQNIEAAFTTQPATMSDAEWTDYQNLVQGGRDEAQSQMLAKVMSAIKRRVTKEYNDQKAAVREEVAGEVDSRPEFKALKQLRETPMDQATIADIYGGDALAMLPKQVPPVYKANGVSPNDVAELSGFTSADEMVRTLMGVETARQELRKGGDQRSVREVTIAQETDARMLERYGDPFTDGSIEEEALAAIHNDKAGEVMAAELRVLSRGTRNRPTPYSVAKAWASKTIRDGIVSDVTSRSAQQRYRRAASKAGKAFQDAIIAQDADEAFRQKQAQMLNNALLAESTRVGEEVDAAVKRMSNWAKRKTVKSVDQDYLERAQALLSAVEMRPRSQASIDKQAGFEAWAAEQEALGHDIVVPASFAASLGSTHWSRLSVDQLLGLDAAVSQVIHLGKLKQTLLDGKAARDKEELIREAQGQGDRIGRKPPSDLQNPDWKEKMQGRILTADAALLKMETVVDWLDEGKSNGVFNRIVFKPIAEAEARERAMLTDYYGRIREAFGEVGKDQLKRWDMRFETPELLNRETGNPRTFKRSDLVAMALNMGNEGNVQRLLDGYGYNEQAVRDVLNRELTAEDWQFVQKVWDIIDTLWPEISQLERKVNGVEPDKVEATSVVTPHGTLRGGYYPAIYDSTKDYAAERNAGKESDLFESIYSRSTTRASSTKERATKVKRPILLDLGVINRHLGEVIHDITHREAVMNADKFLSEPRVKKMIDETLSPEHRKMFRPWLKFVANQWAMERAGNEGFGKFMTKLRANTTVVGMGFRFTTMLNQIAGYSNSFEYVGAARVSAAIAATAKAPIETTRFVMEKSAEVRNRLDTLDRDINATMRQMAGSNKAESILTAAKKFAFHGIGYMDRVVVVPTWMAAYNKALEAGKTEDEAIYAGDKAVRISQGAGSAKDLAAIQRGTGKYGEALKLMTMFYSYFSAVYQRQRSLGRDIHRAGSSDIPGLAARAWWLLVVPPILSQVLSGNGPDDDEDWAAWSAKQMLFNSLGPIPGVRDIAQPAWDAALGNKGFDYQLSPVQRAGQSFVLASKDVGKIARGEDTKQATRDILEATGYATGLVPGQVAASTQFLIDIGSGDADPQTLDEWYTGLTKGKIKH